MVDTKFAISDGTITLPLASSPDEVGAYRLNEGTAGLGLPGVAHSWADSPAGGGRLVSSRTTMRDATLVIEIEGTSRLDTEEKLVALGLILDSPNAYLRAMHPTRGELRLGIVRTDGGEDSYTISDTSVVWTIGVQCPEPYWVATTPVTSGMVQATQLSIVNPGDAPAPVEITQDIGVPSSYAVHFRRGSNGSQGTIAYLKRTDGGTRIYRDELGWHVENIDGVNRFGDVDITDTYIPRFPFVGPKERIYVYRVFMPLTSPIPMSPFSIQIFPRYKVVM